MPFLVSAALWLILFVSLGRLHELFPFLLPLKLGKVSMAVGLGVVLATNIKDITFFLTQSGIKKYIWAITILALCAIPFSVYASNSLDKFISYLNLLIGCSIITALGKDKMKSMQACIIVILFVISTQMIINTASGRVSVSMTYDPNDIALLCVVFLPFALYGISYGNFISKIFCLATSAGTVGGIALSGSRGGLVALACVAIYSIILAKKRRFLLIVLCALGAVVFMAMAGDALWERMNALMSGTDYNLSTKGDSRLAIWGNALELMMRRPLFGVGIGQFSAALGMLTDGPWKTAHNSFLQVGVELGVGGLFAFCAMLYFGFKTSLRGSNAHFLSVAEQQRFMALRISTLAFCTGGFFVSHAYSPITYTLFCLIAIMHYELEKNEKQAQQKSAHTSEHAAEDLGQNSPGPSPRLQQSSPTSTKAPELLPPTTPRSEQHIRAEATRKARQSRLQAGDSLQQNAHKQTYFPKEG